MRKRFETTTIETASHVLLLFLIFSMPFSFGASNFDNILVVLWGITILLNFKTKFNRKYWPHFFLITPVFLLYFAHFFGLFKTNNFDQALFELEKKVGFLIFPLFVFFSSSNLCLKNKEILSAFLLGCLLAGLVCLSVAVYSFFNHQPFKVYHEFSDIINMHASYLAMYFCFALMIVFYLYSRILKQHGLLLKVSLFLAVGILSISILVLASRTQIILLVLGIIGYAAIKFNKKFGLLKSVLLTAIFIPIVFSLALVFPRNAERFKEAINYNNQYGLDKEWGEQQIRFLIWDCSFKLIKSNLFFGVGIGDVQDELQMCYDENNYFSLTYFKNTKFNAHNQFLETTIALGLPGLLLLVFVFLTSMIHSIKQMNFLHLSFLVICFVSFSTESMLERQKGIIFFVFFNSFLLLLSSNTKTKFQNQ